MKINGKIITSLKGLSQNFVFFEIWQKMTVFMRDINPTKIDFDESQKVFYEFLISADKVILTKDSMRLSDTCLNLTDNQKGIYNISNINNSDKVKIITIHALANHDIHLDSINQFFIPFDDAGDTIFLSQGKSISLSEKQNNVRNLKIKKIIVPSTSPYNSRVGQLLLKPGQATFGVFNDKDLVKVCPNELSNHSFHLQFHLLHNDEVKLIVTYLSTGNPIAEYTDCTFFGLLGEDNFLVLNNGIVDCFNDEHLMNMIRQNIGIIDEPKYFDIYNSYIEVTLKDGFKKNINY